MKGQLPEGWKVQRLGEVCELISGQHINTKDYNTEKKGTGYLTGPANFGALYPVVSKWTESPKRTAIKGDILITVKGSGVGKINLMISDELAISRQLMAVRCTNINIDYIYSFLLYQYSYFQSLANGAAIPGISRSDVLNLQIPLPPLPEQKRIVAILDKAFVGINQAVANAEKNLANGRELFESIVINNIFGDPDQKQWKKITVVDLAVSKKGAIRTGPFGSQLLHSEFVREGIAVLGIDNAVKNEFSWGKRRYITEEKYKQLIRYTVKPGDVIITIMGTCGRCAIVPVEIPTAINTKHLCCISLDRNKCLPEFLHSYFLYHPVAQDFLSSRAKGSIMSGLNMGIIKELLVRIPPIAEQKIIVGKIKNLDSENQHLESIYNQKLKSLQELKQSILQKAFSGELTSDTIQ